METCVVCGEEADEDIGDEENPLCEECGEKFELMNSGLPEDD
jgi:hypothetical protein